MMMSPSKKRYGSSAKQINFITYRIGLCISILFQLLPPPSPLLLAVAAANVDMHVCE